MIHSSGSQVVSSLSAMDYNSLAKQYRPRPTSMTLHDVAGSSDSVLYVLMDGFAPGSTYDKRIGFSAKHVDKYLALIDKYREWESQASARGDVFSKELGKAPAQAGRITFTFTSGSEGRHYLHVDQCSIGRCPSAFGQYYDLSGAEQLEAILGDLHGGRLATVDATSYR